MGKFFHIRRPRLHINRRGKISLSGGGLSIGGKGARINVSRQGVSYSIGGRRLRFNSRRGASCGCLVLLVICVAGTLAGAMGLAALMMVS